MVALMPMASGIPLATAMPRNPTVPERYSSDTAAPTPQNTRKNVPISSATSGLRVLRMRMPR